MKKEKKEIKPVRSILDTTALVAHANNDLSTPFIIGMDELVKIYKKDMAKIVNNYIAAVKDNFYKNPKVATFLLHELKGSLPGYVASPDDKEVIADFFEICETQLFTALKNSIKNRHPKLEDNYNIGDLLVNKKQAKRLIVGVKVSEKKGKEVATYQYMDGDNKQGTCDHVSMVSWLNK